jgi:hypothetical protein
VHAKSGPVANNVFAVAQPANLLLEQAVQPLLALDQRQLSGALAVREQKIEGEEEKRSVRPSSICWLEPAEHWRALGIESA